MTSELPLTDTQRDHLLWFSNTLEWDPAQTDIFLAVADRRLAHNTLLQAERTYIENPDLVARKRAERRKRKRKAYYRSRLRQWMKRRPKTVPPVLWKHLEPAWQKRCNARINATADHEDPIPTARFRTP